METISREELKAKIDSGSNFKLVMTMGTWAFDAKHIPGSLNIHTPQDAAKLLQRNDEIIVYCSNPSCMASQVAYHMLRAAGYSKVRRYAGGIEDWDEAGYPIEGEMVT